MKRIAYLLLSFCLVISISSCGNKPFSENPDAIDAASKSVVEIKVYDKNKSVIAGGSGFFAFDSKTIITNYHVIENAYEIKVVDDDDNTLDVSLIYNIDKEKDVAILQIDAENTSYAPLKISSSENLQKGENVVAIGSPLGLKNTISKGTISNFVEEDDVEMIQFTASISHGSSGGALFNDSGEVIGITSGSYVEGQNLNIAIPASEIVSLYGYKPLLKTVTEYYDETVIPTIKSGILTVGVCDWIPFVYIDHTDTLTGVEVEMLENIAKEMNLEIEFKMVEFHDLLIELDNKSVDCVAGGMMCTPERNQVANATNPTYSDEDEDIVFYVNKNNIKLQAAINDAIYKFQNDGTFDDIFSKYGMS